MTNWPNIQEYRNLEAKFFENLKEGSAGEGESESIPIDANIGSIDWSIDPNPKANECKTVRCVIRKDFEETFKKFDRGDGLTVNQECQIRSKVQGMTIADQSAVDKVRLENHLKWKKQKEEEFWQRKEAEKAAQQKKKEEEIRMEKIKKQKEKEAEEKMREWQEQKAREKEGRKREKIMMKALEEELKEAAPVVDKEKLIEDWVKLKDRQRLMEAEKKAEILRREEENKTLRQNLAALSYRQWKEKVKGRMMTLPKNGYQIFGPKPRAVVKEDWNHNFASGEDQSPMRQIGIGLRNSKSNTSTIRSGAKEVENISREGFYLPVGEDPRGRSPFFHRLKNIKSGIDLFPQDGESEWGKEIGMPLKELQPGAIGPKKEFFVGGRTNKGNGGVGATAERTWGEETNDILSSANWFKNFDLANEIPISLPSNRGDRDPIGHPASLVKKSSSRKQFGNQSESGSIPIKKKIDLYIEEPILDRGRERSPSKFQKKLQAGNGNDSSIGREIKKSNLIESSAGKINSKTKFTNPISRKKSTVLRASSEIKLNGERKINSGIKESGPAKKIKICRRSRSCDKPPAARKRSLKDLAKSQKDVSSSSRSSSKIAPQNPEHPPAGGESKSEKIKTKVNLQRRKIRMKRSESGSGGSRAEKREKKKSDSDAKGRKKLKKKVAEGLSSKVGQADSPYSAPKRTTLSKIGKSGFGGGGGRTGRRKIKEGEATKSDDSRGTTGKGRKPSEAKKIA